MNQKKSISFLRNLIYSRRFLKVFLKEVYSLPVASTSASQKMVLINNVEYNLFFSVTNYFIAKLLTKNNCKVLILSDDGLLKHYDNILKDNPSEFKQNHFIKRFKREILKIIYRIIGIKNDQDISLLYFSQFASPPKNMTVESQLESVLNKGLNKNLEGSHRRFFGGRSFDQKNSNHIEYLKINIKHEIILKEVLENFSKQYAPHLAVILDGTLISRGVFYDFFNHAPKTKVLVYGPYRFDDRAAFIGNSPKPIHSTSSHWDHFSEKIWPHTSNYKQLAHNFITNRFTNGGFSSSNSLNKHEQIIKETVLLKNQNSNKKILTLYPNVTWDGAIQERDRIFNGLTNWIEETVRTLSDEFIIIIREHPLQKSRYTRFERLYCLLEEEVPHIINNPNVIFINGLNKSRSYSIATKISDINIIYSGTLICELGYLGVPTISAGNSPFSNKGLSIEPQTKEEYFKQIRNFDKTVLESFPNGKQEIINNALKSIAYQFIYNLYYIPTFPMMKSSRLGKSSYWNSWELSAKYLNPTKYPPLKKTIDRIINETKEDHL